MKSRFKFKKQLQDIADQMGLTDETLLTGQVQEGTQKPYFQLVNNQRRFVKGMLKLPLKEQATRITELKRIIAEQALLDAAKPQG
jgi:transcription antitermination factor NusA-like protein